MIRFLLFDLDETLYPPSAGIMERFRAQVLRYLHSLLGLPPEEAEALRRHYFQTYGTTLRGLQLVHGIDPEQYLRVVHDIPLEGLLAPNPALAAALDSLPFDKVVFTNASREHAERVLSVLRIRDRFSRIVDVRDLQFESKPQPGAYRRVCRLLGAEPEQCAIVEDNVRNLLPAKALGMTTILVQDGRAEELPAVDVVLDRIEEIGSIAGRLAELQVLAG